MISLELPKSLLELKGMLYSVAKDVLRPIARKYDEKEHVYPKELDMFRELMGGDNSIMGGGSKEKDGDKIVKTKKVKELLYASIYDWEWAFIHRPTTNFPSGLAFSASYPTLEVGYSNTSVKFNEIWLGYNSERQYVFGYRWDDRDNIRLADPPGPDYYIWINLKDIPVSLQDQISIITLRLLKDEKQK